MEYKHCIECTCQCTRVDKEQEKVFEIVVPDIGVHPRAMMIKPRNALVANATVFGTCGPSDAH